MKFRASRLAIAFAGVAAFGSLAAASAASLGPVTSGGVGANDTQVAACDSDGVTINYTTAYSATSSAYEVIEVTLSGVAAPCNGRTASIMLQDAARVGLGTGTAAVAGETVKIVLGNSVSAAKLERAALVIS